MNPEHVKELVTTRMQQATECLEDGRYLLASIKALWPSLTLSSSGQVSCRRNSRQSFINSLMRARKMIIAGSIRYHSRKQVTSLALQNNSFTVCASTYIALAPFGRKPDPDG